MIKIALVMVAISLSASAQEMPQMPPSARDADWVGRICRLHAHYSFGWFPWSKEVVTYDPSYERCKDASLRSEKAWRKRWDADLKKFFDAYMDQLP